MINLRKLIDLLPFTFKDRDSYKNQDDEGILERFLDICGNYFADDILPDIDNLLDSRDASLAHPILLNHIWEFFGNIPYAYGTLYSGGDWEKYKDIELNRAIWEQEIIENSPRAYSRDILRYAISLYKIRGTLSFYDILLSFYGMGCSVDDPTGDLNDPDSTLHYLSSGPISYDEPGLNSGEEYEYYYDEEQDRKVFYDENNLTNCNSCIQVTLNVYVNNQSIQLTQEVKDRVLLLLNRFRPIHVGEFTTDNVGFYQNDGFNYVFNFNL